MVFVFKECAEVCEVCFLIAWGVVIISRYLILGKYILFPNCYSRKCVVISLRPHSRYSTRQLSLQLEPSVTAPLVPHEGKDNHHSGSSPRRHAKSKQILGRMLLGPQIGPIHIPDVGRHAHDAQSESPHLGRHILEELSTQSHGLRECRPDASCHEGQKHISGAEVVDDADDNGENHCGRQPCRD